MQERLDERAPHCVLRAGAWPVAVEERAEGPQKLRSLACGLAEEHSSPHRRRPRALVAAEESFERLAELIRAQRPFVEEGELPALDRFEQLGVAGCCSETGLQLDGELGAERVEPGRFSRRHLSGERRNRPN